jgi:diguanylate cyclase (GGDEF)-like protein/PAS domain S-box-containing protein
VTGRPESPDGEIEPTAPSTSSILDELYAGVVVIGPAGQILAWNRRAVEMLGISEDDLLQFDCKPRQWEAWRHDGTPFRHPPWMLAASSREPQVDLLLRVRIADRECWMLIDAIPVFDDAAELERVTVSFRDATSRQSFIEAYADREKHRLMADSSADGLVLLDTGLRCAYASPAVTNMHGWTSEELIGMSSPDFWHPDDASRVRIMCERLLAGGPPERLEYRVRRADGGWTWVESHASPVLDPTDAVTGVQLVVRDISQRRVHQEAARLAGEEFAMAFVHAPIGMALVSLDGRWQRVNPALCASMGYSESELLSMSFQDVTHPDDLEIDMELLRETLAGQRPGYNLRKRYFRADGRLIWAQLSVSLVHDDEGQPLHFISQIQDVTELRVMEERLRELADRDYLTGLLNRRRFEEELRRQLDRCARHGERAALLILDLDDFKTINDTRGHAAGDSVLRSFAELLSDRSRTTDLVARLGGDEFAVVLVDADRPGALRVADALVDAVRSSASLEGLTVSIGVTGIEISDEPDSVLARADAALYAVKHRGRDGTALDDAGSVSSMGRAG